MTEVEDDDMDSFSQISAEEIPNKQKTKSVVIRIPLEKDMTKASTSKNPNSPLLSSEKKEGTSTESTLTPKRQSTNPVENLPQLA